MSSDTDKIHTEEKPAKMVIGGTERGKATRAIELAELVLERQEKAEKKARELEEDLAKDMTDEQTGVHEVAVAKLRSETIRYLGDKLVDWKIMVPFLLTFLILAGIAAGVLTGTFDFADFSSFLGLAVEKVPSTK